MKATGNILYCKKWFWALLSLSFVLLVFSICVLQFEKERLRVELLLSSIILYSTLLINTIPYFINNIYNKNDFLSETSFVFYIFIIIFCILSIVCNAILAHKINTEKEHKYESVFIVVLSSLLFLLYLINLIIETKMKISIHDTVQNFKKYRMKQQDQYVETKGQILHTDEGDKKQPIYIRKEDGSTTTENSKSIISNFKKYWRNDDQHQFIKTEELIHGEPAYIKIKKGEPVSYTITLSPTGSHRNLCTHLIKKSLYNKNERFAKPANIN